MTPRKIAIISDWFLPRIGGLELHMRDLGLELRARGHDARVITATPGPELVQGLPVHRLPVPVMPGIQTIRGRQALRELEQLFQKERFEVVHCHTILSPLAHAAAYVARQQGVPCVLTEHSVLRGVISLFRALDRVASWGRWPDVLTAVSTFVAAELGRVTGNSDVTVLPNGIRASDWSVPRREEGLRVVSVMRLTKRKRPLDLIEAVPRILDELAPAQRPRFTIVGDGPERDRVRTAIQRLGVGAHVELLGFLPREEIRQVLSRSSLFVLPTRKEALSIATMEARCVGLPVVAMDYGGVGDLISHGSNGFLAKDWHDFIRYIVMLARDRALRARMSEATLQSVDRFSWEQVIRRHEEVYDLAIARCYARRGLQPPQIGTHLMSRAHPMSAGLPLDHEALGHRLKAAGE